MRSAVAEPQEEVRRPGAGRRQRHEQTAAELRQIAHTDPPRDSILFTLQETADQLKVSRSTVKRLVASHLLPVMRINGVVRVRSDVLAHLIMLRTQEEDS